MSFVKGQHIYIWLLRSALQAPLVPQQRESDPTEIRKKRVVHIKFSRTARPPLARPGLKSRYLRRQRSLRKFLHICVAGLISRSRVASSTDFFVICCASTVCCIFASWTNGDRFSSSYFFMYLYMHDGVCRTRTRAAVAQDQDGPARVSWYMVGCIHHHQSFGRLTHATQASSFPA